MKTLWNFLAATSCFAFAACGGGGSGSEGSAPTPANSPPVAIAGATQNANVGATVQLDGSSSKDAEGAALSYRWALTSRPYGSTAVLANSTASNPTFVADLHGTYTLSLVVSDGVSTSSDSMNVVAAPVIKTRINGAVTANTSLTVADSPYEIVDRLQVADGVTLTVEPGAAIYGGSTCTGNHCVIEVFGTFTAVGSANSPIQLHGLDILKGANGIRVIGIEHARMKNTALEADVLRDSVMAGAWIQPVQCLGDCRIERNVVIGGSVVANQPTRIANNVFYDQHVGFSSSPYAIEVRGSGLVVRGNSFMSSDRPCVLVGNNDVDLTGNYWGTTSAGAIGTNIVDRNDDLNILGYGSFEPYLLAPDSTTPDILPYL